MEKSPREDGIEKALVKLKEEYEKRRRTLELVSMHAIKDLKSVQQQKRALREKQRKTPCFCSKILLQTCNKPFFPHAIILDSNNKGA
jgi:hypothetical protein